MNERILNEFSLYFKRVIRIEKYINTHGPHIYNKIYDLYLKHLRYAPNGNKTIFEEIYETANKTNDEKLSLSFDKMYISEVLSFFSHRVFLKDIVHKNFFNKSVQTNKNDFRKIAKSIKEFRNCICHYDTKQFSIDKSRFVDALLFFEKLLDCRYRFTSGAIESISHKLNIKSILELIYNYNPEYFDDDRVLVNVFDDIAVLSGYRADSLPQYKSIIRSKFKLQEDKR